MRDNINLIQKGGKRKIDNQTDREKERRQSLQFKINSEIVKRVFVLTFFREKIDFQVYVWPAEKVTEKKCLACV